MDNISYLTPFSSYCGVLVKLSLLTGCLCLTPSFGVNPWTLDCESWPHKTRHTTLSCGAQNISICWTVLAWITSVTNRRTDA